MTPKFRKMTNRLQRYIELKNIFTAWSNFLWRPSSWSMSGYHVVTFHTDNSILFTINHTWSLLFVFFVHRYGRQRLWTNSFNKSWKCKHYFKQTELSHSWLILIHRSVILKRRKLFITEYQFHIKMIKRYSNIWLGIRVIVVQLIFWKPFPYCSNSLMREACVI